MSSQMKGGLNDDFSRGEGQAGFDRSKTGGDAERFVSGGTGNQSEYQDAGDSGGMGSTYHDTRTGIGGPLGGGTYGGQTSDVRTDRAEAEAVGSSLGESEGGGRQDYGQQSSVMSGGVGREGLSETTSAVPVAGTFGRGDYVEGESGEVRSVDPNAGTGGPGYYDRLYNGPQGRPGDGGIGGGAGGRDYSAANVLGGVTAGIVGPPEGTGVIGGTPGIVGGMGATSRSDDRSTTLGSESQYTERSGDTDRTPPSVEAAVERMKHSNFGEVEDTNRPASYRDQTS